MAAPDEAERSEIITAGLSFVPIPLNKTSMNPFSEGRLLASLVQLYRLIKPDIVHHVTIKPVLFGSIAARFARVPAVVNAVSGMGYIYVSRGIIAQVRRIFVSALYRIALRHKNSVTIVQNQDDLRLMRRLAEVTPVCIRGVGVNKETHQPVPEPTAPLTVVMISRLLKSKGVAEFVHAAETVKQKHPDTRFIVVGDIPRGNRDAIGENELASWKHEGRVEFVEYQPTIRPWLEQSTIVCLPSYREGLPKILVEAAALQRALVATDVPGCREIVVHDNTGLLVPARNTDALAQAILRLIGDCELRHRLATNARKRFLEGGFDEETVLSRTLEIYSRLTEQKTLLLNQPHNAASQA